MRNLKKEYPFWKINILYESAKGQSYFFDHFDGLHTVCTFNSIKYPDPSYPDWKWGWTHGTPTTNGTEIFKWHNYLQFDTSNGEGIFSNYIFTALNCRLCSVSSHVIINV